ncbi:MAG TPA: AsmA family protein [Lysobacter sp.]
MNTSRQSPSDGNSDARSPLAAVRRHPWLSALGLLAIAIIVLVLLWDWNWFRGPVERQVEARTGREFDIGGDLDVDLDWTTPTIRADAVRFGNAAWSKQPTMAATDRVEFQVELWPLLRRDLRIPDLRLSKPRLHLETGPQGIGNWKFGESGGTQPQFRRVWIDDGKLRFLDARQKTDIKVGIASDATQSKDDAAPPVNVEGGGRWQGKAFTVRGRAESPLELRNRERPYRIDARAAAGATRAHARGTLLDPLRLRDFDLKLALSGQDMADLYPLLGIAAPPTPPYALDGRFTREITAKGDIWHYEGFTGKVGDSDLSGSSSVETGRARPFLRANLVSKRLDFDDLAGFLGKAPQAGSGEATNPALAAQAARERARTRILPDTPYDLKKLRAMDADVRLRAHRINAPKWPLDDMDGHLLLENGLLRLEPLNFGVAGGDVRSTIRMDARESPIRTRAQIAARGLNLPKLLPDLKLAQDSIGKLGGDVALTGRGNSIAAMLGSSDGDVAVGMGKGQISNLLMELAGIDIAEALKFLVSGDRKVPIRCAFGDFSVRDGVMTTRALAFDTTDTIIVGEGTVSLRDETLDLKLRPRPKDRSLFALRAPLRVDGTFKDPGFHPDYARIGLRGALALTLGNIAPPAALLATIELGPGEDSGCGGRYAK